VHSSLQKYIDGLLLKGAEFRVKIMGASNVKTGKKTTATMFADVFSSSDDPDAVSTAKTPFGVIHRWGAELDPLGVYSVIIAPPTPPNLFQGDVVELDMSSSASPIPAHKYSMVISHSCDLGNGPTAVICPVYRESEITGAVVNAFQTKATNDPNAIRQKKDQMLKNTMVRFAAFPPPPVPASPASPAAVQSPVDESFVVALGFATAFPAKVVTGSPPVLRLSYRGLSFLQWRLATLFLRDVQDSDETREY
jgi:hypothetical protein